MEGSVAEGISTSLQTCPLFSQPYDAQGLFAFENLPSPPSIYDLHVNDLGLTPSPGSQQLQPTHAIQALSRAEEQGSSDGDARRTFPDGNTSTADIESSSHAEYATSSRAGTELLPDVTRGFSQRDIHPLGSSSSNEQGDPLFYDPLFDSDFALQELEAAFESRKRTNDEALPEFQFWGPPEKRRLVEYRRNPSVASLDETPSLSSPESSLRPDHVETAPSTPAGIARPQTPSSQFDSLDCLFEDPAFHVPLQISGDSLPLESGFESTAHLAHKGQPHDAPSHKSISTDQFVDADVEQAADPAEAVEATTALPSLSEMTKQRFSLRSQDLIANTNREVLKRVCPAPEYSSPYPLYAGPLGYLPSAPGIHVKCIEVMDDQTNHRISNLKNKVQQLTYERNKYKTAWFNWTTVDRVTGKTKEQLLQEENAMLRRVSSQHQGRVEQYKREVEEWKSKLRDLSMVYNNLLYEIQVQRKIPAVAPVPSGYKPHNIPGAAQGHFMVPNQQPTIASAVPPLHPTTSNTMSPVQAVTIDLTAETSDQESSPLSHTPSVPTQDRVELLQSLRKKRYDWLENGNPPRNGFRPSSAPQTPQNFDNVLPERSNSNPPVNTSSYGVQSATTVEQDVSVDCDDELARAMEEELARG